MLGIVCLIQSLEEVWHVLGAEGREAVVVCRWHNGEPPTGS